MTTWLETDGSRTKTFGWGRGNRERLEPPRDASTFTHSGGNSWNGILSVEDPEQVLVTLIISVQKISFNNLPEKHS